MIGVAGSGAVVTESAFGSEEDLDPEFNAILVDTTMYAGCRTCEASCAEAHGLPAEGVLAQLDGAVRERFARELLVME